jgi:uncharacterized membrane protein YozB (DUF420 family)
LHFPQTGLFVRGDSLERQDFQITGIIKNSFKMIYKALRLLFWMLFFVCFFYFLIPKFKYLSDGIPEYMGKTSFTDQLWFVLHIVSGVIVYSTGIFQFLPAFRNKHLSTHRKLGKIFIAASLLCIISLYFIIQDNLCASCKKSQFLNTALWLIFISLAIFFIKKKRIQLHQRFMISSFICASYFVTVRLIDKFGMGFFKKITSNEDDAFLYSDFAAWLVPLIVFWSSWGIIDFSKRNRSLS